MRYSTNLYPSQVSTFDEILPAAVGQPLTCEYFRQRKNNLHLCVCDNKHARCFDVHICRTCGRVM